MKNNTKHLRKKKINKRKTMKGGVPSPKAVAMKILNDLLSPYHERKRTSSKSSKKRKYSRRKKHKTN